MPRCNGTTPTRMQSRGTSPTPRSARIRSPGLLRPLWAGRGRHGPPHMHSLTLSRGRRDKQLSHGYILHGHNGNRPIFASLQPCRTCTCPSRYRDTRCIGRLALPDSLNLPYH
ncbi:hypothetical protein BV20DRAFT_63814 [Pilatotrama ljubarskyi]|nr:hypothetical protein BV20DRAFT_63814 [Pilatotrama ljubarskyi]